MAPRKAKVSPIKLIHTLKGALGLDEETYRATLAGYGVSSSKDLRPAQAALLIRDLEQKAVAAGVWKIKNPPRAGKKPFQGRAPQDKAAYLSKIEALLADAGRSWEYADGMARHMFKVDSVRFLDADQLGRVMKALIYDQKRRAKRGE